MKNIFLGVIVITLLSCSQFVPDTTTQEKNARVLNESKIFEFDLNEPLGSSFSEISGLDWFDEKLIILPQFPFKMSDNEEYGYLYYVNKSDLINILDGAVVNSLNYFPIKLYAEGLEEFNSWGSGYEAIIFKNDTVYLAIESIEQGQTAGYVVKGNYFEADEEIVLDKSTLRKIDQNVEIFNFSEESLLLFNNQIISIYEANGKNINSEPYVNLFSSDLSEVQHFGIENIEYRITDASRIDSSGSFWVINYFWPGDYNKLNPAEDKIITKFGIGKSHQKSAPVERIINLQISNQNIILGEKNPIYIELENPEESRNWEGIVKLDERGFIIATDKFPRTILAFIPFAENNE